MAESQPESETEPDDTTELELTQDSYFWTSDPDEQRRCFILEHMGNADIDGPILVENMQRVFDWLKSGKLPTSDKRKIKAIS